MLDDRISLIDLDQPRPGYRRFVSAWVVRAPGLTYLVDPGPSSSVPHLVDRLNGLGVRTIDYVLLTHLHIDHAGGAAEVLEAFPGARVFCDPGHVQHLLDPTKLWLGARAVLGDVADMYGPIRPVAAERVATPGEITKRGLEPIPTPGHAPHHLAYRDGNLLFVGEAAGTRAHAPGGTYRRPATPPRFEKHVALASLDRLLAIEPEPEALLFGHHGHERGSARNALQEARAQLVQWTNVVEAVHARAPGARLETVVGACHEHLLEHDPRYRLGEGLDADVKERERGFVANSVQGMRAALDAPLTPR